MNLYFPTERPFILHFQEMIDDRGDLFALELNQLPFSIKRYFVISVRDSSITRGRHAHKTCWQAINPQGGSCSVNVINLDISEIFEIEPFEVLVVPPFNWCEVKFHSTLTKVHVFASHEFDSNDYIYPKP